LFLTQSAHLISVKLLGIWKREVRLLEATVQISALQQSAAACTERLYTLCRQW